MKTKHKPLGIVGIIPDSFQFSVVNIDEETVSYRYTETFYGMSEREASTADTTVRMMAKFLEKEYGEKVTPFFVCEDGVTTIALNAEKTKRTAVLQYMASEALGQFYAISGPAETGKIVQAAEMLFGSDNPDLNTGMTVDVVARSMGVRLTIPQREKIGVVTAFMQDFMRDVASDDNLNTHYGRLVKVFSSLIDEMVAKDGE